MRKSVLTTVVLASLMVLPSAASAATITGFLGIGGGVTYDQEWVDGGFTGAAIIDFSSEPLVPDTGTGDAAVVTDATGYFNNIGTFSLLEITDLTNSLLLVDYYGADGPKYAPGGPTNVPNFLDNFTDADASGLHFDLTEVVIQSGTDCGISAVDGCVLGGIFVLTQTDAGMRVSFDVLGFFRNGLDEGYYEGAFATTFIGYDFASFFARLDSGNDISCPSEGVDNATPCTFDGNFNNIAAVPEPATLLLLGTGLIGAGYRRRRQARR